jgi:hypothetical protein
VGQRVAETRDTFDIHGLWCCPEALVTLMLARRRAKACGAEGALDVDALIDELEAVFVAAMPSATFNPHAGALGLRPRAASCPWLIEHRQRPAAELAVDAPFDLDEVRPDLIKRWLGRKEVNALAGCEDDRGVNLRERVVPALEVLVP